MGAVWLMLSMTSCHGRLNGHFVLVLKVLLLEIVRSCCVCGSFFKRRRFRHAEGEEFRLIDRSIDRHVSAVLYSLLFVELHEHERAAHIAAGLF